MTQPIERILIANRGEIAIRIARTCRAMGISPCGVFSEADRESPHVDAMDASWLLGPAPAAESYLRTDRILEAAKELGAQAIHPGFGFLAENSAFARAVEEAGLVFIGPAPESIDAMGGKIGAKALAKEAGVPVIEGLTVETDEQALRVAKDIGFPLLVKASAGGGGKGMKVAENQAELETALESARREAIASFGDGALLLERYLRKPRHIEVQILGDTHGNVVSLLERECSIQRRHQKVIEEAPSPLLQANPQLRDEMTGAAVRLAKAIDYRGAGTVEMLVDESGEFFFLEMNTRLQVEHGVTEMVLGIDLVREQIRVAEGHALSASCFDRNEPTGWSIQGRLYAEDPSQNYLPQIGTLSTWRSPCGEGVRVDHGLTSGTEVSPYYDPMLAKILAFGESREESRRRLLRALEQTVAFGVVTNLTLLKRCVESRAFRDAELHTGFLSENEFSLQPAKELLELASFAGGYAALRGCSDALAPLGFRIAERRPTRLLLVPQGGDEERPLALDLQEGRSGWRGALRENAGSLLGDSTGLEEIRFSERAGRIWVERGAHRVAFEVHRYEGELHISGGGELFSLRILPRFVAPGEGKREPGACVAPTPGTVVKLFVKEGDRVALGQKIAALEAMKMEQIVESSRDGVVAELCVSEGEQVDADTLLARIVVEE